MTHIMWLMVATLVLFQVKHLVCDFLVQPPYMFLNKGNIRHLGGYLHAGFHSFGTVFLLSLIFPINAVMLGIALLEFIVHYAVDWAKVNINDYYGWKCNASPEFWYLLGIDQLAHQLTYIGMTVLFFLYSRPYI